MSNIIHKEKNEVNTIALLITGLLVFLSYKIFSEWQYVLVLAPLLMLIGAIHYKVNYFIDDEWLYIKTGFLNYEKVSIFEIQTVQCNNRDGEMRQIVITDKEGKVVHGTVTNKQNLIDSLKIINPNIEVKQ